jgi:hypothetical protein
MAHPDKEVVIEAIVQMPSGGSEYNQQGSEPSPTSTNLDGTAVQCGPFSPQWTSPSLFCFFYLSFQFLNLHLLVYICAQFHHLFFDRPLSRLPRGLLLNT